MTVFWEKGFTATSMTDLCERMGIVSPSLYAAFGSKEALFAEALAHYGKVYAPLIWAPLEQAATAREGVEAYLMQSARALTRAGNPSGCMLTLSTVASEGVETLGALVVSTRAASLKALESRLLRAAEAGEIAASVDVKGLARMFLGVQQGMSIQARDGAKRRDLEAMASAAMAAWPVLAH